MGRKYYIGVSNRYGNLVAVNEDNLSEIDKENFFKLIDTELSKHKMLEHRKEAII